MEITETQKELKNMGISFLIIVIAAIAIRFILSFLSSPLPVSISNLILESLLVLPIIPYIIKTKGNFKERFGFKKVRVKTLFLCFLLVIVIWPVIIFLNLISQLFVPNAVLQNQSAFNRENSIVLLISVTIFAPFVEEFCFRSFFFNGYKNNTSLVKAIIISSLYFALIHLNLNQLCYAFGVGIFLSLAYNASKSIFASFFMHFLINLPSVISLIQNKNVNLENVSFMDIDIYIKVFLIVLFLIFSLFSVLLSIPIINGIKKSENNEIAKEINPEENNTQPQKLKIINIFCVLGIIISIAFIITVDFILPKVLF